MAEEEKKEEKKAEPVVEKPKEAAPAPQAAAPAPAPASSGPAGLNGPFPAELSGWNWGAFFLTWIWGIGNSVWIALISLISPLGLIMMFVLGAKGNEYAWHNRKFESVAQFKAVQKAWATWGLILFIISTVIGVILMIMLATAGIFAAKNVANEFKNDINASMTATPNTSIDFSE